MPNAAENYQYCLALVELLNSQLGWLLPVAQQEAYTAFLAARRSEKLELSDTDLSIILSRCHAEHEHIMMLCTIEHPGYDSAWAQIYHQVVHIVQARVPTALKYAQGANDADDLAQLAMQDVMNGISRFHHESSLQTWLFTVVSRRIIRYRRWQTAQKRAELETAQSLELMVGAGEPLPNTSSLEPEATTLQQNLLELVSAVLQSHRDPRLYVIFTSSVFEEESLRAIGQKLSLSPARVLALLRQATLLLKNNQTIREWFEAGDNPHMSA